MLDSQGRYHNRSYTSGPTTPKKSRGAKKNYIVKMKRTSTHRVRSE